MIASLNDFLIGIALGVRFRANFSVEDQLGKIVDTILYSKGAFFNPSIFPQVSSMVGSKALVNPKTNDNLRIDNSNFILELFLTKEGSFSIKDLQKIQVQFEDQIINRVMRSFALTQIVRIGYVKRYLFPLEELAKLFVDKTIGKTLGGVNDINLSFSKKLAVGESLVKQGVNDYQNAIFNIIKKADLQEIFMAVDFQHLYDPFLESSAEIQFGSFIEQAERFNSNNYLPWLNSNYMEG
jgi:hypothetical protein